MRFTCKKHVKNAESALTLSPLAELSGTTVTLYSLLRKSHFEKAERSTKPWQSVSNRVSPQVGMVFVWERLRSERALTHPPSVFSSGIYQGSLEDAL